MKRKKGPISATMASTIVGISYPTILRHIESGQLPAYGWRGRWAIEWPDLRAYAAAQWKLGRCLMYMPHDIEKRKRIFYDDDWSDLK